MLSRAMSSLATRRNALQEKEKGFTLIELLVVVIIIGVLAAIAIPVYLGIQNNAKDSAVKSDLTNAKTAQVAASTNNPSVTDELSLNPADAISDTDTTLQSTLGVTLSTAANYRTPAQRPRFFNGSTPTNFCIAATSGDTLKPFHISSNKGVSEGACAADGAGDADW